MSSSEPRSKKPLDRTLVLVVVCVLEAAALALCVLLATRGYTEGALVGMVVVLASVSIVLVTLLQGARAEGASALLDKVDELSDTVREVAAHSALSQDARRVLFRRQEQEALVQAIDEDIAAGEWDGALTLCEELERRLGRTALAGAMRERVATARAGAQQETGEGVVVTTAGAAVGGVAMGAGVLSPQAIAARQAVREQLERRFMTAAQEDRADDAMAALKELDAYLTPEEAEPLRELARGVIGKARDTMGAQFRAAVLEKRWADATAIGERIIAEFPNARMAAEVREVLENLKARAGAG